METAPLDLPIDRFCARRAAVEPMFLLDCREPWEWERVHLPEAVLIPLGELEDRIEEVPETGTVVVYCHHGIRSRHAAALLRAHGRDAFSLAGGIDRYARTVAPELPLY